MRNEQPGPDCSPNTDRMHEGRMLICSFDGHMSGLHVGPASCSHNPRRKAVNGNDAMPQAWVTCGTGMFQTYAVVGRDFCPSCAWRHTRAKHHVCPHCALSRHMFFCRRGREGCGRLHESTRTTLSPPVCSAAVSAQFNLDASASNACMLRAVSVVWGSLADTSHTHDSVRHSCSFIQVPGFGKCLPLL